MAADLMLLAERHALTLAARENFPIGGPVCE
jgi:hypothetical protein